MSAPARDRLAACEQRVRAVMFADAPAMVEPALIQPAAPYLDLSGEDVRARIVMLADEDGAELCLRPDLTIPVARAHAEAGAPAPAAYGYDGWVFRRQADGGAPPLQMRQLGVERFGDVDTVLADVEACARVCEALDAAGQAERAMTIGDAGIFGAFVEALDLADGDVARLKRAFARPRAFAAMLERTVTPSPLAAALAGVGREEAAAALQEVYALAGVESVGRRPLEAVAARLLDEAAEARTARLSPAAIDLVRRFAAIDDAPQPALEAIAACAREAEADLTHALSAWSRRLSAAAERGVRLDRLRFSMGLARQFEYYGGFVFAARAGADEGPIIAAGGRYDGLIKRLGVGEVQPAVGCMVRLDALDAARGGAA